MKKSSNILQKLGLSAEQSLVYRTLLELGPMSPSELVRKTGLHRPAVYKVLPELILMELVSQMPKGKLKVYVAESPKRLEQLFEVVEDEFNAEIHHLYESYGTRGKKPVVTYTEGDKAIVSLFSSVVEELKPHDTYYRYSSRLTPMRERLVPPNYRSMRDKKQLERLVITDKESVSHVSRRLGKSVRAVPEGAKLFDEDITQIIFGKKVAIIDYNSKTVLTIENEKVASFQKKLFLTLWKQLGKE